MLLFHGCMFLFDEGKDKLQHGERTLFWKQVKLGWAALPQMEVKDDSKLQSIHYWNAVGSSFPSGYHI